MPSGKDSEALVANGWTLYGHPIFIGHLDAIITEVEELAASEPENVPHHSLWKMLECVMDCVLRRVPTNPDHADFRLGDTLGPKLTHWRRAKKGMPKRYRLFFQFHSKAPKNIIYAWFNDEHEQRKAGSKSDCYAVFKKMVERGDVPASYDKLMAAAVALPQEMDRR